MTSTRSRPWFRGVVVTACVVLAGSGLWWMARPKLPSHEGKNVYHWMFQTRSSSLEDNLGLKAIGTNAVPFLAQTLRTKRTQFDRHQWARTPLVQSLLTNFSAGFTWTHSAQEVRAAAAFSLLAFGFEARPALPELHAALTDPSLDPQTRQTVVHALGEIGPLPESLPHLMAAWSLTTNNASWPARHDLVLTISRVSKHAPESCLPIFVTELNGSDCSLRDVAAWGVSDLGQMAHAAAPALQRILAGTNAYSQFAAAVALGRVTNTLTEALPRLRELARGTNAQPAAGAALTLWRWGEPAKESIAILTNLLTEKQGKGLAAEYLGLMGPAAKSAAPVLLEASQQDIGAWVDRYDRARCALAALQIAGLNDVAIKELEAALAYPSNAWVRGAVARDLGKHGKLAEPLLPALRHNLNDSDRNARYAAQMALATIVNALEKAP